MVEDYNGTRLSRLLVFKALGRKIEPKNIDLQFVDLMHPGSKGQFISKGLFAIISYSKKQTKKST